MTQNWGNPDTAKQWDEQGGTWNPLRSEQLDILVSILADGYQPGNWILDLGYGSGKVEKLIFDKVAQASVVGVDNSQAMMQLAAKRLADYPNTFESVQHDLGDIQTLKLPKHPYQFAIAIQSLHHLSKAQMQSVYQYTFNVLEPGGIFLLLDRLQVETQGLYKVFQTVWQRQDKLHGSEVAAHEGDSFAAHREIVLNRGDYPVLVDEHLAWLRQVGFETACIHLHGNRGLFAAVKP
ncbi:class I SAM-dependent methyltransferase [Alicyclobacillus acidoterrestris]|uniref:Class I SAM-dependent methyltransferase n=1 Tax=Alicyclobacillus acidoterrestris (strain ATCC 49025 / DSM 3922 / CIP 106132 / NCIMB 13137 / GD3B) TaxID=1356854 RepID=A0A9E7CV47_ALIAG|nr:class I SAM-dependent methyltransferase [Alicyclobacillus acidoterrestris]UNO47798.1 class I SAM-dependent methyltransferase [Alicyclobacillus acidoterrestris]GEO27198.1 hypothetical protein AAC03nite_29830 [Alicyclobacillus acidoterrestris]